jgi:hypothetical protein
LKRAFAFFAIINLVGIAISAITGIKWMQNLL